VDTINLRVDPSGIGYCEGCNRVDKYVSVCFKCDVVRCEMCMPAHLASHDPGGLGMRPVVDERVRVVVNEEEATMFNSANNSTRWIMLALFVIALVFGGIFQHQIWENDTRIAVDERDIAILQRDLKEIKDGIAELVRDKRAQNK